MNLSDKPAAMRQRLSTPRQPQQTSVKFPAIDSTARNGETVQRRRFQRGSVFLNNSGTMWTGQYTEYVLNSQGVEVRQRPSVILCPATEGKRAALRALQPYLDKVNNSLSAPAQEKKSATLEEFLVVWKRDYLSLTKPSTQSGMKSSIKRLEAAFSSKDMRKIDAGDIQRLISALSAEGLNPKSIRNLWGVASLIWNAALAQKYVDALLPKPKLPKRTRREQRFFTLPEVGAIISTSIGAHKVFYWLAAETGMRAGELAGLRISDIKQDRITINQSVWHGKSQSPKTAAAVRTIALSPQLAALVQEQARGRSGFLFASSTASPWDMNLFRERKLRKHLEALGIEHKGFHAFRHFNVSLMDHLRVPKLTRNVRIGHASTGDFGLDVYGHPLGWDDNVNAAHDLGAAIENAALSAVLTAKMASESLHSKAALVQ